ncbi:MAG TPA: ABC transporter permease [Acidimicrobiales bacterium]|nr:ABC transporter permease [Acidimicrobiales bacterium]
MRALLAQVRAETWMTLRRGETLLVTIGIPIVFVVFFSEVHVLPTGSQSAVSFVVPGVLALAVMSTAMVSLGIATGFERGYGVLKRLGSTPLRRDRLVGAKILTVVLVELVQAVVLIPVGLGLGWRPGGHAGAVGEAIALALLATVAFGGLGLLLAGLLRAEVNLAVANGLYLVLLLLGGMLVPLAKLPGALAAFARALPAAALSGGLHATLGTGVAVPTESWVVLALWAVVTPVLASLTFRWE